MGPHLHVLVMIQLPGGTKEHYRGLNNYQYYFGGSLLNIVIVFWAPKPYSNY